MTGLLLNCCFLFLFVHIDSLEICWYRDLIIIFLLFTPTMSAADFYQSKIDELEDNQRDRFLTTDELIDNLEKKVMRLARSKYELILRNNDIFSELQEKDDQLEICAKDKLLFVETNAKNFSFG